MSKPSRYVYLDHNATTPVHPAVREAMRPYLAEHFGNASSPHWAGAAAAPGLSEARQSVARLVGANSGEIVFTGTGSESDNLAVRGALMAKGLGAHAVISAVEHPAVHATAMAMTKMGYTVTIVDVDASGAVVPEAVRKAMRPSTALVSVMLANNETGVMNPVAEIAAMAREHGALMHTDAVQAVGKIPVNVRSLGVDLLTGSGHKFNAPKGVGFLYVRDGVTLVPQTTGGHQEGGLRAGTENMPGIAALGAAAELAMAEMPERRQEIGRLRDMLESGIIARVPDCRVNGDPARRIYNTSNVSFDYIEGEAMQMVLNSKGIAVATGSACASGTGAPSRTLSAMGLDAVCARGAVRMSLGYGITEEDVDYCIEAIAETALRLQEMSPLKP